jgi:hypothetical protein
MRLLIFLILIFPLALLGQSLENQIIMQDVAVHHTSRNGFTDKKINSVVLENNSPVALLDRSNYKWNGEAWSSLEFHETGTKLSNPELPKTAGSLLSTAHFKGELFAGAENGLFRLDSRSNEWQEIMPRSKKYRWAPYNVAVLVVDSKGRLWFGAEQGVGFLHDDKWTLYSGDEGLPYNNFTCAAAGPDGIVWFGTKKGAIRYENDKFYYRFSLRWLPDDYVNGIAVQEDGTAWIATNRGMGQIISRRMTFEEKAGHFIRQTEIRNQRDGFISPNRLAEPYDTASYQHGISDNDGKYTSMYGAAHAYRYAITGSKEAKELAVRSFEACKWLVDITHEPGFPARVIIPADFPEPLADPEYSHKMNIRRQQSDPFWKDINPRFVKSDDGNYLWKCDTSSDELAGHYFFYAIYYDLVAETEEEKEPVREVVADITDHLIRNGFFLRDHDGEATRWGNFSPEFLDSYQGWYQRGLNSMMMLSFLNVAKHVTGDHKYDETAAMLREKYNYHINAMHGKEFFPPKNVVPWDNNLCLMSMIGLIKYEKDPELLIMYRESLEYSWLHISKQKNAFWDALYAATAGYFTQLTQEEFFKTEEVFPKAGNLTQLALEEFNDVVYLGNNIEETLRQIPLDLIGYEMDNTHRLDVVFDPTPGQRSTVGWRTDGYALPVDERGHVRQDRDGFALHYREVGGVHAESEGTFFLLPYYMARYYNLIK